MEADKFTVVYDANGQALKDGTGLPMNHSNIAPGGSITVGAGLTAANSKIEFLGWDTDPQATTPSYQPKSKIENIQGDMTLYAIWKNNTPVVQKVNAGYFVLMPGLAQPETAYKASQYFPADQTVDANGHTVDWSTGYIGYIKSAAQAAVDAADAVNGVKRISISSTGSDYSNYLTQPQYLGPDLLDAVKASTGNNSLGYKDIVIEWYQINNSTLSKAWPDISNEVGKGYHVDGYVKGIAINVVYYPNHSDLTTYKEVKTNDEGTTLLSGDQHTILTYGATGLADRPGYTFTGWNTKADGSGDFYTMEQAYKLMNALTLYAQWEKNAPTTAAYTVEYYYGEGDTLSAYTQTTAPTGAPTGETVNIGTTITPATDLTLPGSLTVGDYTYNYKSVAPASLEVTADGANVIKVYYEKLSYTTSYAFVSGTQGKDLPDALPTAPTGGSNYPSVSAAQASKSTASYGDVYVSDGKWSFTGWDNGVLESDTTNVKFTGAWTFTAAGENVTGTASFTIKKVGSDDTSTGLSGAVFTLTPADAESGTSLPTGTDGTVSFSGLTEGTYTLVETSAPTGYEKDSTTWTVSVAKNGTTTVAGPSADNNNVIQKVWNWVVGLFTDSAKQNAATGWDATTNTLTVTNAKQYTVAYHFVTPTGAVAAPAGVGIPGPDTVTAGSYAVKTYTGTPTNAGYSFSGWYIDESCQTSAGSTLNITGNADLYGYWTRAAATEAHLYKLVYSYDGSSVTDDHDGAYYSAGSNVTLKAANTFSKENYSFSSWNVAGVTDPMAANAPYTVSAAGRVAADPASGYDNATNTTTYYWIISVTPNFTENAKYSYTVTYHPGYTDSAQASVNDSENLTGTYNTSHAIEVDANSFTRANYTFAGWATTENGAVAYNAGAVINFTASGHYDLYAVWTENTKYSYTVTYNGNGGSLTNGNSSYGDSQNANNVYDASWNVNIDANTFEYAHHSFVGWNTEPNPTADKSGTVYTYDQLVSLTPADNTLTLYAQWEPNLYGMLVTKTVSGAALPDGFYIEVTGGDLAQPITLRVANADDFDDQTNTYFWYLELLAGTYSATEYGYQVDGYTHSGVTSGSRSVPTTVEGEEVATIALSNSYSYIPPYTPGSNNYSITVNYISNVDGSQLANAHVETRAYGNNYDVSAYDAIGIAGYVYDRTEGDALSGRVDGNKVINVYYDAEGEPTTEPTPVPTPTPTPTDIPDENPPLNPTPVTPVQPGTDIPDDEPPLSDAPKTGDETSLGTLWVLLALGLGGLGLCTVQSIRSKKRSK